MNRRALLRSTGLGAGFALFSGCLSSPAQTGSGHPCDDPRNIDYQAVDGYQDHGVYLKNSDEVAHTTCVTITEANRDREETAASSRPLKRMGYAIRPEMEVKIFKFKESGRYTIEVSIEETTKKELFEVTDAEFDDGETRITTFEITGAKSIQVTYIGDS